MISGKYGLFILLPVLLLSCSRSIDSSISALGDKDQRREAEFDLVLSRDPDVVTRLIERLQKKKERPEVKREIIPVLYKLYFRKKNPEIEKVLLENLSNPDPLVRVRILENLNYLENEDINRILIESMSLSNEEILHAALETLQFQLFTGDTNHIEAAAGVLNTCSKSTNKKIADLGADITGRLIKYHLMRDLDHFLQSSQNDEAEKMFNRLFAVNEDLHMTRMKYFSYLYNTRSPGDALYYARKKGVVYDIKKASGNISIDGKTDDAAWRRTAELPMNYLNTRLIIDEKTEEFRTWIKILYRGQDLYIAIKGHDPLITNLNTNRAMQSRDSSIWMSDSYEMFLQTESGGNEYNQIILSYLNEVYDGFIYDRSKTYIFKSATHVDFEEKYWSAELKINVSEFNTTIRPGKVWRINFVRTIDTGDTVNLNSWPTYGHHHTMNSFGVGFFK